MTIDPSNAITPEMHDALLVVTRRMQDLESRLDSLGRESGAASVSVETGDDVVVYYDDDGTERLNIGLQPDGRFAIKHKGGAAPPKPTAPDTTPVLAGVLVGYDGTFEDDEDVPSDLAYYEVHASTVSGYAVDDTNMVGTMYSPDGGTFVHGIATAHEVWYYSIVAVDYAGNMSEKSDETPGTSGGIRGYQDSTEDVGQPAVTGPGNHLMILTFKPLPNSTVHVYWNGEEQPDNQWTLDDWIITFLDPDGCLEAGDRLDVKYLYTDTGTRPPLTDLTLRGIASTLNTCASVPLPTETVLGDFIVVVTSDRFGTLSVNDPRLTLIYEDTTAGGPLAMYVGIANSLADLDIVSTNIWTAVGIAAYIGPAFLASSNHLTGNGDLTSLDTLVALLGVSSESAVVAFGTSTWPTVPSPWVKDMQAHTNFAAVAIFRYAGTSPSPASTVTAQGNVNKVYIQTGLH